MNVSSYTTSHESVGENALKIVGSSTMTAVLVLTLTFMVSAIAYYFVGFDQGAVSVFGSDTHVHEFVHDARHFLGFPCH
ncbi:CbtB-domain containing protein [Gordonia polyisoprenivorans]|nr:CbtB-domain containing protein [Gordonia polyisoprenivorans]